MFERKYVSIYSKALKDSKHRFLISYRRDLAIRKSQDYLVHQPSHLHHPLGARPSGPWNTPRARLGGTNQGVHVPCTLIWTIPSVDFTHLRNTDTHVHQLPLCLSMLFFDSLLLNNLSCIQGSCKVRHCSTSGMVYSTDLKQLIANIYQLVKPKQKHDDVAQFSYSSNEMVVYLLEFTMCCITQTTLCKMYVAMFFNENIVDKMCISSTSMMCCIILGHVP